LAAPIEVTSGVPVQITGPLLDPDGSQARSVMRTQPSTEETGGAVRTWALEKRTKEFGS
jgi:hypothetical protein